MAKIQIGDRIVEVDDSFLTMSPADQQATVDEIESSLISADTRSAASGMLPSAPLDQPIPGAQVQPPQAPMDRIGRNLQVGAQGLGRSAADLLGAPVDLTAGVLTGLSGLANTVSPGIEYLLNQGGEYLTGQSPEIDIPEAPRFANPIGGSDSIANAASYLAEMFGYDVLSPEEMNPTEKLGYNINRFGGQAVTGGAGLAKAAASEGAARAPAFAKQLMRPYQEAPGKALIGDLAGGSGSGAALSALDEYAPEQVKENPLVRLLTMMAGGIGAGGLATLAAQPARATNAVLDRVLPGGGALYDEATGNLPRRGTERQAARFLQENASDLPKARQALDETMTFMDEAGGAQPTLGAATDDPGLRYLEKVAALKDPKAFQERYEAIGRDASNDIDRLLVEGADMEAPSRSALRQIDEKRGAAQANVEAQEIQLAQSGRQVDRDMRRAVEDETTLGGQYRPYAGGADQASIDLDQVVVDQTMRPMQARKNEMYTPKPGTDESVDVAPLLQLLDEIERNAPIAGAESAIPSGYISDLRVALEDGSVPFSKLAELRPGLSERANNARSAPGGKNVALADNYKKIKGAITDTQNELAESGSPLGNQLKEANRYYEEEFAPLFNRGEGKSLRKDINRDDLQRSATPPTKTAGRFLKDGPGGQEAAADLQRILAQAPDPAAGQAAARRFVLDSLSKSVVQADGTISEAALQKWINNRQGMLSQVPELADEVSGLLARARSAKAETGAVREGGKNAVERLEGEVKAARAGLKQTDDEINRSALSLYIGNSPENAIKRVMSSGDPVKAIKELKAAFAGDAAAEEGFKAAAADHLSKMVTTADGERATYQKVSQAFKKYEPALQEIFGDDIKYLRQAQTRLGMLSRKNVQAVAGSGTIENAWISRIKKPYELVVRMMYGALQGGSMTRKFNLMADQWPDNTGAANDLLRRALLDPKVAKHLFDVPVKELGTPSWNRQLMRLMRWSEAARSAVKDDEVDRGDEGGGD